MSDSGNPLDRLTRPGGRQLSDDESIPVLTERLTLPSLDLDISLPKPPPPVAAPPPPTPPPSRSPPPPTPPAREPVAAPMTERAPMPPPAATPAAPVELAARPAAGTIPSHPSAVAGAQAEIDWPQLERTLRDAVLRELQPVLGDEAARLLRERMHPAIERALQVTTTELRHAFDVKLHEVVARVVAHEIARLRERR